MGRKTLTLPEALSSTSGDYYIVFETITGKSKKIKHENMPSGSGAPEGAALSSTGETGGIKYLREDGDGTCSWQTPDGSGDMVVSTYDPANISEQLAGLTAAQTLTNKTFTTPLGIVTNDITESTNKNYVTDAESTIIGNTSGTNAGDQTSIVGITGNKAQFDAAVTDGDILYVGDITSNITTNLSEGTTTETTVDINSSDGANATIQPSSTSRAGVMTKAKFDEVVVNNAKVSYTDAAQVATNKTNADASKIKTDFMAVTQSVDLDTIESDTNTNNTKTSNIVQTDLTSISDSKANFNTSLTDGSFMFVGDAPTAHTHVIADITDYVESKSITVESPSNSEDISIFFTNKAITVTEIRAVRVAGTTATWTIRHGTDRNATGAEVVTSGTTTTSNTTGSDVTSFNDATIIADSFVWLETSGTVDVDELSITIYYTID